MEVPASYHRSNLSRDEISGTICQGLNDSQAKAAAHFKGPCMVLAGPGSGKTFTIAKRIEYLIRVHRVKPEEILVITFTKYAAKEMKQRFLKICGDSAAYVTCGTFHGIYYGILKWAYRLNQSNLLLEEEKYALIRQSCGGGEMTDLPQGEEQMDYLKELAEEIGNVKNNCQNIDTYESVRYGTERFREIYRSYETMKKKMHKIDFEDMLILCKELFEKRKDILGKWQNRFRYILVDEFQDVNQAQYDVIRMLASPQDNLFVVGDDDQSIYGFRGAKPGIMMAFDKDYPDARKILLDTNYRSNAHIVRGALRVICHNKNRYEKEIRANRKASEVIHVQETTDPIEESKYILSKIQERHEKGIPYTDMSVLYRTITNVQVLTETLSEYQIPFSVREQIHNIYDHFIGTDISSYFHLAIGEYERKYFLQVINRPNRYVGRDSMEGEKVTYESLRNFYCDKGWMMDRIEQLEWDMKMIRNKTPYAAIQYLRKSVGYEEFLESYAEYRNLDLKELISILDEIQERSKEYQTIEEWFAHVEAYGEALKLQNQRGRKEEGVALLTMHTAKGLEFDTVFIMGANEGNVPYKKAKTEEEIEEERRLFYVAMTRAKQKLVITYVKEKNGKEQNPSRFVDELLQINEPLD